MGKQYYHLGRDERVVISLMLDEGRSLSEIARKLGRSKSTVSREIKRNGSPLHRHYTMPWVQVKAQRRKSKACRRPRLKNDEVRRYVQDRLRLGWSPEQISGRIGMDLIGCGISHEAIYQYIYALGRKGSREYTIYLRHRHCRRRKKRQGRKPRQTKIPNRVSIDERPLHVELRQEFGHWESDTLCFSKRGGPLLNTLVERKTLLLLLAKKQSKSARDTSHAIIKQLEKFPKRARRTLTLDNGTENAGHEDITAALGIRCYFAYPYASWQRGINENINGLVRGYLPKSTNSSTITDEEISLVEDLINNRPRKRLGYKTPIEAASSCVALRD